MKYSFFLFLILFLISTNLYSAGSGNELIDRKFYMESNVSSKYESDKSINIYIYIKNMPDSLYLKYLDDFKWTFEGLPTGASFNKNSKSLKWDKFYIYTGDFLIKTMLTTPYKSDTMYLKFEIQEEWKSFFIPGVSYTAFFPQDKSKYGTFQGFSIEYLIYSGINRNENKGPSHIKVYAKFDLMTSTNKDITEAFNYSMGLDLSFERNPKRRFLIPFFGLDLGFLYQKEMGHIFCFTPTGGVWLYSDQNLMAHFTVGYLYPAESIEKYRGLRVLAGLNFSLW